VINMYLSHICFVLEHKNFCESQDLNEARLSLLHVGAKS
jgi:hypothetical protein